VRQGSKALRVVDVSTICALLECYSHEHFWFGGFVSLQHELFAPVMYIIKIRSLEEAIELNNAVPQGLASSLFTKNQV
jgi:hypothetical protein